ncbi:MAG: pyruvate, phosphate dikinase [candidate division Zixibacteria bacterium]|nr:pyruvate, phosphate dikinase [candidate division Zixibacteria bacterium]MDH3937134.1 pyruvate, phosphate dikinase [candidate division Zixibacteria bacterium]MDH4033725.1 pyruvate, phosphate dikinase [candidate division Zixibacteria bacterium]
MSNKKTTKTKAAGKKKTASTKAASKKKATATEKAGNKKTTATKKAGKKKAVTTKATTRKKSSVKKTVAKKKVPKKAQKKVQKKVVKTAVKKVTTQRKTKSVPKQPVKAAPKGKFCYSFGGGTAEGNGDMRDLLGGKGAGLAEMTNAGIPVPPGFTITTDVCKLYYENALEVPKALEHDLETYMAKVEKVIGKKFGDPSDPLLVSVRSGARFSMPGMMDTVLNLGLTEEAVNGLAEVSGNMRFALDNYRRFIAMFGNVVMGIDKDVFEHVITKTKTERRIKQDSSLQVNDLKNIVKKYKQIIKRKTGESFPQDPYEQLRMARDAVFRSWNSPRAISYRRIENLPGDLGTAVNVQAMVYGNMGNDSGTGVGFTRNPATGAKEFYGEYLLNAQGEDVVAGVRTPQPIKQLNAEMPDVYKQLKTITGRLEMHYRDVQDFEFTIERGKLYMLQTRSGKRTVQAAIRIAVDMVAEKLITKDEAIMRIDPQALDQLLHPSLDPKAKFDVIAVGLPASPGAASGKVYFTAEEAVKQGKKKSVVLVREETNPDDIEGMHAAVGILTARGGMTSHAAVVARGMGKCCVSGAEAIRVNAAKKRFQIGKLIIKEGETITLNGSSGDVILGEVPTIEPELSGEFSTFMEWADEIRTLKVRTNADTPRDALQAVKFGAEGIGLCRTEHMFFAEDRIPIVQEMILADSVEDRQAALDKLLPMQKKDFQKIFIALEGKPVTIRTLDPPLHEFLPRKAEIDAKIAGLDKKTDEEYEEKLEAFERIIQRIDELTELNPMLGHRGCRLGIVYPEITEMQVRAIMEAACAVAKDKKEVHPEIMIPLIGHVNEFKHQKEVAQRIANQVIAKRKIKDLQYLVGTMIEIPRAALTADEIAEEAEFFSFGTNDLTQMTMGFSRDDAGKFLSHYVDHGILPSDPFITIDQKGIGQLVRMGHDKGVSVRSDLKVGICGEHGGDPDSIDFCHRVGLDYVSCSPYRVPIARLAAAQSTLRWSTTSSKKKK